MKNTIVPVIILLLGIPFIKTAGQIDSLIVETYYISDNKDATDTDGGSLEEGSTTYRVYLDLADGFKIMNIFGTTRHPLIISSTEGVFNNTDRGARFGFEIGAARLEDNTTALDSWMTIGFASTGHSGILKESDPDGSIVGGSNNDGGSEGIAGGLLTNTDDRAGIPLTGADGLIPSDTGNKREFDVFGISDTSLFGPTFKKEFYGAEVAVNSPAGVKGTGEENLVLISQITTKGSLNLKINVTLQDSFETNYVLKYSPENLAEGENYDKWLTYPYTEGCTDPNHLEYDPAAIIDDGSCMTGIIYGCMDTAACNFDPTANFNVEELCCFSPSNCGGRNIEEVCEGYVTIEEEILQGFSLYPNPAGKKLRISLGTSYDGKATVAIYDLFGREQIHLQKEHLNNNLSLDLSDLREGLYFLRITLNGRSGAKRFVKYTTL